MKDTAAARKYAKALFQAAKAQNQILACQQGLEEMARIARLRRSLGQIFSHPFIAADEKAGVLRSALGEYSTPLLERFLLLLVKKRRFDLLFSIAQRFQELVDQDENIQAVNVRSALAISDAQQAWLKLDLEKWLGSTVRMEIQVEPQLIGGVVIQTRDRILDQSLRGQLQALSRQLMA